MSQHDDFDRSLARWFDAQVRPAATADVLDRSLRATRRRRPRPRLFAALGSDWVGDGVGSNAGVVTPRRTGVRASMATLLLLFLLVLALVAGAALVGARLLQPTSVDLGIFAPVAGRIVYGDERGIWGVDPASPADSARRVQVTPEVGIPLGWSSDGTHLLILRGSDPNEHLVVLDADGSEIQVTEGPWSISGASISPDGSRVIFTGVTTGTASALYAVDANGGPAERLHAPGDHEHLVQQPTFSPDGTRIAYAIGGGDHSNNVWLMDADGGDAHPIVSNESNRWPGHVRGLAWSPVGDRLALGLGGKIYTFAPDGSNLTHIAGADTSCGGDDPCAVKLPKSAEMPYWSPDGSQIGYTTDCIEGAGAINRAGCGLAIARADGSNARMLIFATSGPWHPASLRSDEPSPVPLAADQLVLHLQSWPGIANDVDSNELAAYADGRVIWLADQRVGYFEQRLTPEGVERLRARAISTGLFEGDLALLIDAVGFGAFEVRRGDRTVIVTWGNGPVDVSSRRVKAPLTSASSAQALEVRKLRVLIRESATSGLPDDMYAQPEITPFIPSHLWVSYDRGRPDWSELPSPAREVVTRIIGPGFMDRCENISLDQAREIAQVLERAGVRTEYDDQLGLTFSLPSSFVHAHPALPHQIGTVCGEG